MPSWRPRSERMTEMKWMQEERKSGSAEEVVRSWGEKGVG